MGLFWAHMFMPVPAWDALSVCPVLLFWKQAPSHGFLLWH